MSGPYNLDAAGPDQPTLEGDGRFLGLNLKLPRWQLPPGFLARSENQRLHNLVAEPRPGTLTPVFANTGYATPAFLGSGPYSNPNGREVALLVDDTKVFAIRSGTVAQQILCAVNPRGNIEIAQQFDKVLMHSDDPTFDVLVWDGLSAEGFVAVEPGKALGNGIEIIPNPPWSINYLGRAWFPIPHLPGWIGASDVNDYTTYDSVLHQFRINTGTSDAIVGLYPYPAAFGLIVGKEKSFDLLGPIPGDLGDSWLTAIQLGLAPASAPPPRMNVIPGPRGVGIRARRGALFVGNGEFHFLSDAGAGGIYRLTPAGSGLAIDPTPVSDPIEPLMRRINWSAAGGALAELDGIFALWAVPIDGATYNNAILVYNIVTQQWQSLDLWPAASPLRIDNLIGFDFYGRRRVYAVSHAEAVVRLLYEGRKDRMATPGNDGQERRVYPIAHLLETRGYSTMGATGNMVRQMSGIQIALSTLAATVTTTELVGGVNDETELERFIPDRRVYDVQGRANYLLDNSRKDFLAPKRQDYSIEVGDDFAPGAPIPVEAEQEHTRQFSLSRHGRYVSYRIAASAGSCTTQSTVVESKASPREGRKG